VRNDSANTFEQIESRLRDICGIKDARDALGKRLAPANIDVTATVLGAIRA
jgi:hypothetical protein